VTSLREDGSLLSRLFAKRAYWRREDQCWTFYDAQVAQHRRNQAPEFIALPNPHVIRDWMETPAQILKPGLAAANLGFPDLTSWLRAGVRGEWEQRLRLPYVTHWHYRLAHPFGCLLTALMAVPLAAYVTRRPNSANVMTAFCLSALMLLMTNVFLALGESGNIPPWSAVWLPVLLYAAVGLWMMSRRNAGCALW
jgi:lipopolysaccharide export LptBFGC system permease protein LptF